MTDISLFNQTALSKIIEQTVPPDRTNAVVGVVDSDGFSVVAKFTKGTHWELQAAYKRDWGGTNTIGAKVIYSW